MKFLLTFKTPYVLDQMSFDPTGMSEEEREEALNNRQACERVAKKFVQYGELLTVELDTDDGTARVIPVRS